MKEQHTQTKLRGTALAPSLATVLEQAMQSDMAKMSDAYPDLKKLSIQGEPVGKIVVFGTAGDMDSDIDFQEIFKSPKNYNYK